MFSDQTFICVGYVEVFWPLVFMSNTKIASVQLLESVVDEIAVLFL